LRFAACLTAALAVIAAGRGLASPVPPAPAPAGWRIGSAPHLPSGIRALGPLAGSTPVNATVTLAPRDPGALAAYARAVATPGSAVYHRYLTVAQFAQRFGPTVSDVDLARASLAAEGLNPGPTARDGLSIPVQASAARLASAFSTAFDRYRLADGHTAYANRTAPSLPSDVAGIVQGIIGLDSLARLTPAAALSPQVAPGAASPCSLATTAAGSQGHTADRIAAAYGLDALYGAGDLGAGTTVALYELEPFTPSDVAAYQSCYRTAALISTINVDGGSASTPPPVGEAALDIEDVVGLAPQAAVEVYQGPNDGGSGPYDTLARIVSDDTAQVISTSWGLCEHSLGASAVTAESTLFQEAAVQGQSVVAASGDSGADDCGTGTAAVDDPASQPYVTGVGGTTLSSTSETAWSTSAGAGGGGVSSLWPAPSYQAGAASPQTRTTCGASGYACRQVPDVSADADPQTGYPISFRNAWYRVGGTSAAAPTWAALLALADASPSCAGKPIGFANPALYGAARSGYASTFTDIVSGTNSHGGVTGFTAATGYDMASGLGTPRGAALVTALCTGTVSGPPSVAPATTTTTAGPAVTTPPTTAPPLATIALGRPGARTGRVGIRQRLQASATDSAGLSLRYGAAALPAGLRIDSRSGLISGSPTRAGVWTVTLSATDSRGAAARTSFRWTIAGRPSVPAGSLRLDRAGRPVLSLTIAAGAHAAAVRRVAITAPAQRLRFAAQPRARGISARSGGRRVAASSRLQGAALVVSLRPPSRTATITVRSPRVSLGASRGPSLRLTITVTDADGVLTTLSVKVASA
jgi:hypothetical protein